MKFVCDGLVLSEAVAKTSKACAIRTTAPIMECIKLSVKNEEVTLFATDGELSIEKAFKAEVFEEGEICVPGKLFTDFVSKLTSVEVTIQTGEKGLEIKYLDSGVVMQVFPADEYPKINMEIGETSFSVKKSVLKRVIADTVFCCAQDDSRPVLKGCLMELKDSLEVTALDGYRLALASAEIVAKSGEGSIICPARTLVEIARSLSDIDEELTVYTQGGMLLVSCEGMTIVSRLYQGEFIKKENVLPQNFTSIVTVKREEIISSVERAAILIRGDKNNLVTLEIAAGILKVSSNGEAGNVAECISAQTDGKDIVISMNAKYLLDALHALSESEITLSFNGAISPFILQNKEKKDSLYLILPVRNAQ